MSLNRREFLRRVLAGSGILITGLLSSWELIQKFPQGGGDSTSDGRPPASGSVAQTVTDLQTVTVTEYASGQSAQQSSTSQQSQTSSSTSQAAPPGYVLVAPLSALAGKTSAYFNHPSQGLSILVNSGGQWRAFSATCTHAPCTVQYAGSSISCPCHGGSFNPNTGAVQGGPPPVPLQQIAVLVQNGNLYAAG